MLQLTDITKDYLAGDSTVHALKGISLTFRDSEFVSILGPSGCGKTTLLNIIGGLDRYTSGDLCINGRSTKEYKDRDWDAYRNHSVGFVFQNYNLIPHLDVLANVELALTLSGVSKNERKRRAAAALEQVGLKDQMHKKPNQMSGGQMQRVAIARALVNDPEILLADEPTGALDTVTSVQIMDLLKEISHDRLIIMVTHNPDLAISYSSRVIRLLDGEVTEDSNPVQELELHLSRKRTDKGREKHTTMSFWTALALSFKNLMTKKARTFLTAFAGSIGIIGIALILSLSHGVKAYINRVEEDTLSSYPITIEQASVDMSEMMMTMMASQKVDENVDKDAIYSNNIVNEMLTTMFKELTLNDLGAFKTYLEEHSDELKDYVNDIQYSYGLELYVYDDSDPDVINRVNPSNVMSSMAKSNPAMSGSTYINTNAWNRMLDNEELIETQYDVLAGHLPEKYNEVVLIVDENNRVSDYTLYSLGLLDPKDLEKLMKDLVLGNEVEDTAPITKYAYDDIIGRSYKLAAITDYFVKEGDVFVDKRDDDAYIKELLPTLETITVVGIIRPNPDAITASSTGVVGYRNDLYDYLIDRIRSSEVVKAQLADPDTDIFTGIPFPTEDEEEEAKEEAPAFDMSTMTEEQMQYYMSLSAEEQAALMAQYMPEPEPTTTATYEGNLSIIGYVDPDEPSSISIYPSSFDGKEKITDFIKEYNEYRTAQEGEESSLSYTDYIGLLLTGVSSIINTISYVLIAFVAISLVVSSIMIGIITYISVLERTKEIGVLRSIGASKKDISNVFNAETFIVGLVSGLLGIGITILIDIPANIIIKNLTDVSNLAQLPIWGALILIAISVLLTLIAGLLPSRIAAKKDPVIALRSE